MFFKRLPVFNLLSFIFIISFIWLNQIELAGVFLSIVMYSLLTGFGIEVSYHRYWVHKSFTWKWNWLKPVSLFVAAAAATGSPIMWLPIHMKHHKTAGKEDDPHPPSTTLKTLIAIYPMVENRYYKQLMKDKEYYPIMKYIHDNYFLILYGISLSAFLIGGSWLLFYGYLLPVFLGVLASNAINYFGHVKNSISYSRKEIGQSYNNILLALLTFGEGLHNDHHRFPGSCKLGSKWYEVDLGYWIFVRPLSSKRNVKNELRKVT